MKMLVEKAALYRQHPASVKLPWLTLLCTVLVLSAAGCTPTDKKPDTSKKETTATPAPSVPLRVWFAAEVDDKAVIERQWLATYDRPIEVTLTTAEDLLGQAKPACDVIVYPAWMLGELVARDWLTELPSKLQSSNKPSENAESDAQPVPAGWLEQARYNRKAWGLSMSVLAPVIMGNFDIPKAREVGPNDAATSEESLAYWQSLIEALKSARASANSDVKHDNKPAVDYQAVCDRYLTVLFSVSDNENIIGTLFHPDTLKPRVTSENFATAARLLQELYGAGADSLLLSHSEAWIALTSARANVAIGLPPMPSVDADKVNSIVVSQPPANPARAGMRISAGWNSGRGLMVSLSKQCRQTSTAIDFSAWLASDASRTSFAKRIAGIYAESAYAPGSSPWQAQRIVQRLGQQSRLPSEPRLPQSLAYRQVLGEQIASVLQGQKSIQDALAAVDKAWQEITAKSDPQVQIPAYVQSLGL